MIVVHIPSWFPDAGKPLNGNFILRQIETIGTDTDSVILHHTVDDFTPTLPESIHFHPIRYQDKRTLPLAYFAEFKRIIQKYGKPDLIHLHVALPLGPVAASLARKHHIPLIISEHWSIYQPMNRVSLCRRTCSTISFPRFPSPRKSPRVWSAMWWTLICSR